MDQNQTRSLWISVAAGVVSVLLIYSYLQEKNNQLTKQFGAKERVVVAKSDIPQMQVIDDSFLDVVEKPVEFIQPGAVKDVLELVGTVALTPILEGEQILGNKVTQPSAITGLSLQVSPGKRAVTIPIDEMRGVAKLLKPGDRVDLLALVKYGAGLDQKKRIQPLMENVPVLATGERVANQLPIVFDKKDQTNEYIGESLLRNTKFTSITVEVSPRDAQKLIYVLSNNPGDLFITLRHPTDSGPTNLKGVDVNNVLGRVPASGKR